MVAAAPECDVIVDEEFRRLVPPLTEEERLGLEENLLRDGCLDPLVVWAEHRVLLDGHNRKEICDRYSIDYTVRELNLAGRDDAKRWIIEHQFGRRNLTPYQRAELALELKPLIAAQAKENERLGGAAGGRSRSKGSEKSPNPSVDTRAAIAKVAGISGNTIAKAEYLRERADEATQEKLRRGETTVNREYRELKKAEARKARVARKAAAAAAKPPDEDLCRLICADIAAGVEHVDAASVDWVITDPPYGKQHLDLYDRLAELAAHALKPGGSLVAMVGQSYVPDIMARLASTLEYHWTLAYLTPGGQAAQLWGRRVNTFWKPLLWYVKGRYEGDWIGDVCRSGANDKEHHHWGQSESGMADILERFTDPGQTLLDPFLGAGTTGVVAVRMGRQFIGMDVDPSSVAKAETRIRTCMEKPE